MQGMQRKSWAWMLAGVLFVFAGLAHAQRVEGDRAAASGAYEAEVTVRSQAEAERNGKADYHLELQLCDASGEVVAQTRALYQLRKH